MPYMHNVVFYNVYKILSHCFWMHRGIVGVPTFSNFPLGLKSLLTQCFKPKKVQGNHKTMTNLWLYATVVGAREQKTTQSAVGGVCHTY